jgi:hypothetical protein
LTQVDIHVVTYKARNQIQRARRQIWGRNLTSTVGLHASSCCHSHSSTRSSRSLIAICFSWRFKPVCGRESGWTVGFAFRKVFGVWGKTSPQSIWLYPAMFDGNLGGHSLKGGAPFQISGWDLAGFYIYLVSHPSIVFSLLFGQFAVQCSSNRMQGRCLPRYQ